MITNIEQLLQDYASYSFMEGTIDENTMNHLIEDSQNYITKLNELKLLSLHNAVWQSEQLKAVEELVDFARDVTNVCDLDRLEEILDRL